MNNPFADLLMIIGALSVLVGVTFGVVSSYNLDKECEAKGGVIVHKNVCVKKELIITI